MKRLSAFIVLSTFISVLFLSVLSSCGEESGDGTLHSETLTQLSDSENADNGPSVYDSLPLKDYGGYEFKQLVFNDAVSHEGLFISEAINGEIINDAIYERNSLISDRYNIVIKYTPYDPSNDMGSDMLKYVMAGDNPYDLYIPHTGQGTLTMLKENIVYNWREIPQVDLDRPWWNANIIRDLEYEHYLPFAVGDYSLPMYSFATAMIFSKNMVENLRLEDLYSLVRSGKWTLEKFYSYIKNTSADINGDVIFDERDQYGFAANNSYHTQAFATSAGIEYTRYDESGNLEILTSGEKFFNFVEIIYNIYYEGNQTFFIPMDERCPISFDEDRVLLTMVWLTELEYYRGFDSDYGIIPLPKYDDKQSEYYTLVNRRGGVFCIPINTPDIERTGTIMEALNMYSKDNIIGVYYDSILNTKYSRDDESVEMLSIIYKGIRFDYGYFYTSPNTADAVTKLIMNKNKDTASYLTGNLSASTSYYEKIIGYYANNAALK